MSKSKKYDHQIEQKNAVWSARITRKITSKKVVVSKEQDGFESEAAAKIWAEQEIATFTKTQSQSNQRQGTARKLGEDTREQRSARRAEKTADIKAAKAIELSESDADSSAET